MKKKNLIVLIFNTVLCIVLLTIMSLAWYTKVTTVSDMSFSILQIDSLVSMYQGNDTNFNGAPDLLGSSKKNDNTYYNTELDQWQSYTNQYYQEKYSFNYLDQKYALSSDSTSNLLNTVTLSNVVPSKIYTFKFEITNYSGSANYLSVSFNSSSDDYISYMNARVIVAEVDSANSYSGTYTSTSYDWTKLTSGGTTIKDNIKVAALTYPLVYTTDEDNTTVSTSSTSSSGRLDIWLQIKVDSTFTATLSNYALPELVLTLSTKSTST